MEGVFHKVRLQRAVAEQEVDALKDACNMLPIHSCMGGLIETMNRRCLRQNAYQVIKYNAIQSLHGRRMCLGQLALQMKPHELTLQSAPLMNSSLMTAACPLLAARCAGVVPTWE